MEARSAKGARSRAAQREQRRTPQAASQPAGRLLRALEVAINDRAELVEALGRASERERQLVASLSEAEAALVQLRSQPAE